MLVILSFPIRSMVNLSTYGFLCDFLYNITVYVHSLFVLLKEFYEIFPLHVLMVIKDTWKAIGFVYLVLDTLW